MSPFPKDPRDWGTWILGIFVWALIQYVFMLVYNRKIESIKKEIEIRLHEYQVYTSEKVKKRYEILESIYHSVLEAESLSYRIMHQVYNNERENEWYDELEKIKKHTLPKSIYLEQEDNETLISIFKNIVSMISDTKLLQSEMIPPNGEASIQHSRQLIESKHNAHKEIKESKAKLFESFRQISLQTMRKPLS